MAMMNIVAIIIVNNATIIIIIIIVSTKNLLLTMDDFCIQQLSPALVSKKDIRVLQHPPCVHASDFYFDITAISGFFTIEKKRIVMNV